MPDNNEVKDSRLNSFVNFMVCIINSFLSLFGLIILGAAIFVLQADWGDLDRNFFLGLGVGTALFGLTLLEVASVGFLGAVYQMENNKDSKYLIFALCC